MKKLLLVALLILMTGCIGPSIKKEYNIFVMGTKNKLEIKVDAEVPQTYSTDGTISTDPTIDIPLDLLP